MVCNTLSHVSASLGLTKWSDPTFVLNLMFTTGACEMHIINVPQRTWLHYKWRKPMRRALISTCIVLVSSALVQAQTRPALENRWADLTSPDEAKATRALLALAASPK